MAGRTATSLFGYLLPGLLLLFLAVPTTSLSPPPLLHKKTTTTVRRKLLSSRSHHARGLSGSCPPGQYRMPFQVFTGRDDEDRRWRYYGYFDRHYARYCSGCSSKSDFSKNNWVSGNTFPGFTHIWPSFEFNAHDYFTNVNQKYVPEAIQFGVKKKRFKNSCNGLSFRMDQEVWDQGCTTSPKGWWWCRRSTPMHFTQDQVLRFGISVDDTVRCALVYEDGAPVTILGAHKATNYKIGWKIPRSGNALVSCVAKDNGKTDRLKIYDDAGNWDKARPCFGCPRGTFSLGGDAGSDACEPCIFGRYQDEFAQGSCKGCPPGQSLPDGSSGININECEPCPAGKYSSSQMDICSPCPEGRFGGENGLSNPEGSGLSCKTCPSGTFGPNEGLVACLVCMAGTYTTTDTSVRDSVLACKTCPAGFYSDDPAYQTACTACSAGRFQSYGPAEAGGGGGGAENAGSSGPKWGIGKSCLQTLNVVASTTTSIGACETACVSYYSFGDVCVGYAWDTDADAGQQCNIYTFLSCVDSSAGGPVTETFYERWLPSGCTSCDTGMFQPASGASSCADCPVARYLDTVGATREEDCTPCPKGKYGTGTKGYGSASDCRFCPFGRYSDAVSVTSCGGECPPGRFRADSVDPARQDDLEDCNICGEKEYQNAPRQDRCLGCPSAPDPEATGVLVLNIVCDGCKPGQYAVGEQCLNCPIGFFTSGVNEEECPACPAGYFAGDPAISQDGAELGSSRCYPCPAGRHGRQGLAGPAQRSDENNACENCASGTYLNTAGAAHGADCTPCSAGRYNEESGSASGHACKPCLPGRYGDMVQSSNATNCRACDAGRYSHSVAAAAKAACAPCLKGYYQNAPGKSACLSCMPGTFVAKAGSEACELCSEGQVTTQAGLTRCEKCRGGKHAPETGLSSCYNCQPGFFGPPLAGSHPSKPRLHVLCEPCAVGQFMDAPGALSACKFCDMGTSASKSGQVVCQPCLLGRATKGFRRAGTNETVCERCEPGFYSDEYGLLQCKPCEAGLYVNVRGAGRCSACLPGQYSAFFEAEMCAPCDAGLFDTEGQASACTPCNPGRWSGPGAVACTLCFPGKFTPNNGSLLCESCPSGYLVYNAGQTGCLECAPGSWSRNNSITCLVCAKGTMQPLPRQDSCIVCPRGTFAGFAAATACSDCPSGWAQNLTESPACGPCVEGRYADEPGTSLCTRCPVGWASGIPQSSECLMCTAGRAQGLVGGTSCTDCQPGFFSSTNESSKCEDCPQGFSQALGLQTLCTPCAPGRMSEAASRVCSPIPDSEDVDPPRVLHAEVLFDRSSLLDGIPLVKDSPADMRTVIITVEEPLPAVGTNGQFRGMLVVPIRTFVWWSEREDFTDQHEIGRFDTAGWNNETGRVTRVSTTQERYHRLVLELPNSLYRVGFHVRIRAQSYLNDTSWTRYETGATLPCVGLLGSGSTDLPCPPFKLSQGAPPEPLLLFGEYAIPDVASTNASTDGGSTAEPSLFESYEASLFEEDVPVVRAIQVTVSLPSYPDIVFEDAYLDGLRLGANNGRPIRPTQRTCLFIQIEWSPDRTFERLFIGSRPACATPGGVVSATIHNFAEHDDFETSIFSYPTPGAEALLFFRVRAFLSDTSSTSATGPVLSFPGAQLREPQRDGDDKFAPELLNNTIMDKWTLQLEFRPPALRREFVRKHPGIRILFLEVQFSKKLQFRELARVMSNADPAALLCSNNRNESSVVPGADEEAGSEDANMFSDIDRTTAAGHMHVPGCRVSDRVRLPVKSDDPWGVLAKNITFPDSIYEQKYFIRVLAVLSDSSVVLQDVVYDQWKAFSRGCAYAGEYLQTHTNNDPKRPYSSVEQLQCRKCPLGAACAGDFVTFADITARWGFRRLTWNHTVFGPCPVPEACLGVKDIIDETTGQVLGAGTLSRGAKLRLEKCRHGHEQGSELCSDCMPKHLVRLTANPAGTCSKCPPGGTSFVMFAMLVMVALGYMAFLITDSLNGAKNMIKNDVPMPYHTIAIRIFSSYLQVAGMLLEFRITLPDAVANLVTVQQSASAVVEQTLNFDCTAGSRRGLELFFLKQTMAAVLPLVLPLVGVIWLLVDFYKRARGKAAIEYRNDKIVASLVVLFYIAFPAIVGRIAITFACTKYGDNGHEPNTAFLMQKSLSTRCYSYAHLVHIGVVTTPAIIFYMLMIPGYLVYKIRSLRSKHVLFPIDKNYQPCWTYRFGFLFGGYEPNHAYWEIVVLMRKAAFVLVTVFTRPAGMASQIMSAVLVLLLSLSAHIHVSPYDHDTHDALESASLHANLVTLPIALLANEFSIVYGTGSIGEGGKRILGPIESIIFSLTAFSSFFGLMYCLIHGLLLEKLDSTGFWGNMARCCCKGWQGKTLTKSKAARRKTILKMASSPEDLMNLGFDTDEIDDTIKQQTSSGRQNVEKKRSHPNPRSQQGMVGVKEEINRLQKEKGLNKQSVSGVSGNGGIGADGVASRVKVRPLLPAQREKSSNSTMTKSGGETALVAGTMGSAYLDLLPTGAKKPRGTIMASTTTSSPLNKPVNLAAPVTGIASPAKPDKAPWLQPGYIETLTLKELKKAYKAAKAEVNHLAYVEYKARYAHAKATDRGESGRAKPVSTSLNADGDESAAAAAGLTRRLSRKRNIKQKAVEGRLAGVMNLAGVVNIKRPSRTIVM